MMTELRQQRGHWCWDAWRAVFLAKTANPPFHKRATGKAPLLEVTRSQ